jgi:hypothetical protein
MVRKLLVAASLTASLASAGCEFIECGCLVVQTVAGCADELGCFRPSTSNLHGDPPPLPGRVAPAAATRGLAMAY